MHWGFEVYSMLQCILICFYIKVPFKWLGFHFAHIFYTVNSTTPDHSLSAAVSSQLFRQLNRH